MTLEDLLAYTKNDQGDLMAKPDTLKTKPLEDATPLANYQVIRAAANKVISFIRRGPAT